MKARFYGIAEIALVISNMEVAKKFYIDTVGFEQIDIDVGKGGIILRIGENRYMGLWEPGCWNSNSLKGDQHDKYVSFREKVVNTHPVFAIHMDDIDDLAQRLTDAGHVIEGPTKHVEGSPHVYVLDPDNHSIEFWGFKENPDLAEIRLADKVKNAIAEKETANV